jgi:hypothetical protein
VATVGRSDVTAGASPARLARREHILEAARAMVGARAPDHFDPIRMGLCAIDVVMVAGSPWLKDGLERDYPKDEAGYKKIGGGANTPEHAYFFRAAGNLMHYLKRAGFYVPRGGSPVAEPGMVCFFDWEDRGRFNFTPDRAGVVLDAEGGTIQRAVLGQRESDGSLVVRVVDVAKGATYERALVGHSDLP